MTTISAASSRVTTIASSEAAHFVDNEWQKNAMLVALIVSVVGVAIAFFKGSILAMVGFVLLGCTGALGFWITNDTEEEKELDSIASEVTDNAKQLEEARKQIEALNETCKKQTLVLQETEKRFLVQIDDLKKTNRSLILSKADLERAHIELQKSSLALRSDHDLMQRKVVDFTRHIEGLKLQISEFLGHNLQIGNQVGAFRSALLSMDDHERRIQSAISALSGALDGDLSQLHAQLEFARQSNQSLVAFINSQKEAETKQLSDIKNATGEIERLNKSLAERSEILRQREADIERLAGHLQNIRSDIAAAESLLQNDTQAYQQVRSKMEEERKLLGDQLQAISLKKDGLEQERLRLETLCITLQKETAEFIENKQQLIRALDAKITEKSEVLKKILKQMPSGSST